MKKYPLFLKITFGAAMAALLTLSPVSMNASDASELAQRSQAAQRDAAALSTDDEAMAVQIEEAEKLARQPAAAKEVPAPRIPDAPKPVRSVAPTGATPVVVTATAGTMGPTPYNTVSDAFAAINAGTHQGAIVLGIGANTTEPGPAVLNSSGAGTASYTSVLLSPSIDGVSISGATTTGRGLIELNGADNVTIDGDNPNTSGINRNLTIQNTAANTVTFTSVVRIAMAATVVTSADNNTIKNLNIIGSSPGRNISTATSTAASENTTFGFFAGPGGSTASATTAPAPITSVLTGVAAGATATNLVVSNNNFTGSMARAINANGSATTVFPGLQINGNTIGNATAGAVDQVTAIGITAQGSTNAIIFGNTVYVEGFIASSSSTHGINVGVNSANVSGATIDSNKVGRARNNNGASWSAFGINLGGGSNHVVQNNFVFDVKNDQTAGTGGFSTTFGAFGIRVASGTGHKVYHNSVHLFGTLGGAVNADLTAAFGLTATTLTGCDVRNNIFSNQLTGGNPAANSTRHACVFLPPGATSALNLTWNNNDYFQGPSAVDPKSLLAQVGITAGTGEYLAANFDPTTTTPAANFRAYTSTLNASGTNDNASKKDDPGFLSDTDLHVSVVSIVVDAGVNVGVLQDIDGQNRVLPPDIGADEASGAPPPPNDIAAIAIITPANGSTIIAGSGTTPQASFRNIGSATQTSVMVQFTITGPGGYNYSNTQTIASLAPNTTVTVTFAAAPTFTTAGAYATTATVITPDANASNDVVMGSFNVLTPLTGSYNVPGDFTSLTNANGIFAALNTAGASGNVTINIAADLAGETGTFALNEISGGFSVTIKPSGAARNIAGNSATQLIKLNGADNVTIDGSLAGGTDRSLTITNAAIGPIVWIATNATSGANGNTVKNCTLSGPGNFTGQGIIAGSGATLGGVAEFPNSNNTIRNNVINRVQNSAFISGNAATGDSNWVITGNTFGSTTVADKNAFRGMLLGGANNLVITNNTIMGISSSAASTASMSGIQLSAIINGGVISGNKVSDIKQNNPTGFGSQGIYLTSTSTASGVVISNNFVSDVASQGTATTTALGNGWGLVVVSGGGYGFYYNSVSMNTNQVAASSVTAAVNIAAGLPNASIDMIDNIFSNTETVGTRYGVYNASTAAVFMTINYNDYFAANVGFLGAARVTLADWQTATGQDAMSKAVDPGFVSLTDLHITNASLVADMGIPIVGITTDIDGQMRSASTPDIGADEVMAAAPLSATSALSRKVHGGAGPFDINLPLGGSAGIECRSGGVGNDYTVVITFSNNVVSGTAMMTGVGSVAGAPVFSMNTMTINLTGVTDVQQITVTATNVMDEFSQTLPSTAVPMKILTGDTSNNSGVTGTDVSQTKAAASTGTLNAGTFRTDVNANGIDQRHRRESGESALRQLACPSFGNLAISSQTAALARGRQFWFPRKNRAVLLPKSPRS